MRLRRRHPSERALRKWGQLTPELRELIARVVRSVAKDAVQDILEAQGFPYYNEPITNADGTPLTAAQHANYGLPTPAQVLAAQAAIKSATRDLAEADLTPAERQVTEQIIRNARGLLRGPVGDTCES